MNDAGRVMIVPKGIFNANTTYVKYDSVSYYNGVYVALKTTTGHLPTDTEYWIKWIDLASSNAHVIQNASGTDMAAEGILQFKNMYVTDDPHNSRTIVEGSTFNGRSGSILPMAGDYNASQISYDSNTSVQQKLSDINSNLSSVTNRVSSLEHAARIGTANNLNDYTVSGLYRFGNGAQPTNKPSSINYLLKDDMLIVAGDGYNYVTQIIIRKSDDNTAGIWERSYTDTWSTWVHIVESLIGLNKNNVVHSFSSSSTSWTADTDCYLAGLIYYIPSMGSHDAYVTLDGVYVAEAYISGSSTNSACCVPVKKGEIILVNSSDYSKIKCYGLNR